MNSPDEKERIRTEIEKRIAQTRKTIENLEEQAKPVAPDRAIGRITRMDAIQQKSVAEANLNTARDTLYKLEEALVKMNDAGFAVCVKCGKGIPLERVLIIPETRFCVQCA